MQDSNFLTRIQSAEYLTALGFPTTKKTLDKFASIGGGPQFHKFGARVLYRPVDLLNWANHRLSGPMASTSDMGVLYEQR